MCCLCFYLCFNESAPTQIYTYLHTLSLHSALPLPDGLLGSASRRYPVPVARSSRDQRPRPHSLPVFWTRSSISRPTATSGNLGCARSEEHTSELQSLMRISYAVFCLKKKITNAQLVRRHLIDNTEYNHHYST